MYLNLKLKKTVKKNFQNLRLPICWANFFGKYNSGCCKLLFSICVVRQKNFF